MRFRILDRMVTVAAEPLADRIRVDEVLPILKALDDQAVDIVVEKIGKAITCSKGCSACCRVQLVPVTPAEAYAILLLVEELPEPRRSEVLARFSDRVERLKAAGLAEDYLEGRGSVPTEQGLAMRAHYFDLGLVCPFLEDDACSIYRQRPFACRQYLVTTPKELCEAPLSSPVETVPTIFVPAAAAQEVEAELSGNPRHDVPLTLALAYAGAHRDELERTYPSMEVLNRCLRRLFLGAYQRGSLPR